jgi:glycosyltransferase involved in cell wall biosynthesis
MEIESGNKLKLKFIGTVDPAIVESIQDAGLNNYTQYEGFLPYKKMLDEICNADFLLVCATEPRHVPGKLFEYLRTGKPIISFGDDNDEVKKILKETNAGMMFSYDENGSEFFRNYSLLKKNDEIVRRFERKSIASSFKKVFDIL